MIREYGVALTLPDGVKDATYRVDVSGGTSPKPAVDARGRPYTTLPGIRLWPASLAADPACSSVARDGIVAVSVFLNDPTGLELPSGPSDFRHVGQYWFGVSRENANACTNGNPNEGTAVRLLVQAYQTIHPA